jgi:hypothetical protein
LGIIVSQREHPGLVDISPQIRAHVINPPSKLLVQNKAVSTEASTRVGYVLLGISSHDSSVKQEDVPNLRRGSFEVVVVLHKPRKPVQTETGTPGS